MHQVSFPHGPEELAPEWFTAIFRANALLISEAVIGLQREVIGQDRGFTGVIVRVFLQYTLHEKGAPSSVVVKFPPQTEEPGAIIIDWQSVAPGRGVIDLGLFLFGSLEITDRRAAEERLLRRYHELLQTAGVTGYSFSQLEESCLKKDHSTLFLYGDHDIVMTTLWDGSASSEASRFEFPSFRRTSPLIYTAVPLLGALRPVLALVLFALALTITFQARALVR